MLAGTIAQSPEAGTLTRENAESRRMALHRIDTHHHPYPPVYIEKTGEVLKHTTHAFYERLKNWRPSQAIEAMDKDGIAVSVLSVSTPSVWLGDSASSRVFAREMN